MRAKPPDQALGDDAGNRRGNQKRRDAHIQQSADRAARFVTVERGQDKVACQRRPEGDLGCLGIADLADQDDIGVLTKNRA